MARGATRLALLALLLAVTGLAVAQQNSKRTVLGQVLDENEKVVELAIVHLKNVSTKVEWSDVTDKRGRYQFNDVDMKVDHEIFAEQGDRRSRTRSISQFDTREHVTINLKLEPLKESDEKKRDEKKDGG